MQAQQIFYHEVIFFGIGNFRVIFAKPRAEKIF